MMYERYWHLREKPFRNTPDCRFLYFSRQHEEALTRMLFAITEDKGAMLLTGDYGCGKTLLSRTLIQELNPERYDLAVLPHPNLSPIEFLQEILHQFGYDAGEVTNKGELLRLLQECFITNQERGRGTIILIDEAQMVLDKTTLEEIRLLLNFQGDTEFYLTLILVGQPELRDTLDELPQLMQRLGVRYHLGALNPEESTQYLRHRLAIAGTRHELFTAGAERLLVERSHGIPRVVNNLADMSLMVACGQEAPVVDEAIVEQVATALEA